MKEESSKFKVGNQILVTGGSRGLGLNLVLELNRRGIACVIFSRNPISEENRNLMYKNSSIINSEYLGDVGNYEDVEMLFLELSGKSIQLGGVVHCAAVLGEIGSIENVSVRKWHETINTNLSGTFHILRKCVQTFKKNGYGNFVALSGGGATDPRPRILSYAASKTAVARLIESVALDYRNSGFTFNCVAPGILPTEMNKEAIRYGKGILDEEYLAKISTIFLSDQEDSYLRPVNLICDLVTGTMPYLTGKLISAQWDDWENEALLGISESTYTLRRVTPQKNFS